MPNPAFVVEGHMEKRALQKICPGTPIRLIGCNGDSVPMSVIARFIAAQINSLYNYYPIVIVFDRERREEEPDEIIRQLFEILPQFKAPIDNLIFGIANRTIENWILCDSSTLRKKYPGARIPTDPEGEFGKLILKKIAGGAQFYQETLVGHDLLISFDPEIAYNKSESFRSLVNQISFECWWTDKITRT